MNFREFLELDAELPKSNQTAALSGKNMMKVISKLGDRVSSITLKMEETDDWFEDKTMVIENLDTQLKKLLNGQLPMRASDTWPDGSSARMRFTPIKIDRF